MNPGRELDALVAEEIFKMNTKFMGYSRYSTGIDEAWEVVEKLRTMNFSVRIFSDQTHKGNLWVVKFVERIYGTILGMSAEESLPHAICLAALKVCIEPTKCNNPEHGGTTREGHKETDPSVSEASRADRSPCSI